MKITREDVRHVADLARLALSEEELERYAGQIDQVLAYIDQLNQVPTEGIAPTAHAISLTNAMREDAPAGPQDREALLANAPQSEEGYFVVPKVIG